MGVGIVESSSFAGHLILGVRIELFRTRSIACFNKTIPGKSFGVTRKTIIVNEVCMKYVLHCLVYDETMQRIEKSICQ